MFKRGHRPPTAAEPAARGQTALVPPGATLVKARHRDRRPGDDRQLHTERVASWPLVGVDRTAQPSPAAPSQVADPGPRLMPREPTGGICIAGPGAPAPRASWPSRAPAPGHRYVSLMQSRWGRRRWPESNGAPLVSRLLHVGVSSDAAPLCVIRIVQPTPQDANVPGLVPPSQLARPGKPPLRLSSRPTAVAAPRSWKYELQRPPLGDRG